MHPYRHPQVAVESPAQSAEVVLYQDSSGLAPDVTLAPRQNIGSPYTAVIVAFKFDQAVTFLHKWGPTSQTVNASMATINGSAGAGETAAANTFFSRLCWLVPGRNRISILAGGTAPTATTIAVELYSGPMPFEGTL